MSSIARTYIQQMCYDGTSYTKGAVVDILDTYNIGCIDFPFESAPKTKDVPQRDWHDQHGKDVFIEGGVFLDDYDIEAEFCYKGTVDKIGSDLKGFLDFIRGYNDGAAGARLSVYDEHVGFGRKDIYVDEVDPQMYKADASDPDALFDFKVKFHVNDPKTEVTPTVDATTKKVTDLFFKT